MKTVVITWLDSCEKHGWTAKNEAPSKCEVRSAGILVKKTKKTVTISTSYCKQFDSCSSPMSIPRSAITKMKVKVHD